MSFLIWLLGWAMIATGIAILNQLLKNVVSPYNKFVFENSNEHGIVALASYDEKVKFDKYTAKKKFLEGLYGVPGVFILIGGVMCVIVSTGNFLLK